MKNNQLKIILTTVYNTSRFKVVQKNDQKTKNKMGRLGRFKNRTEPGKKVTDSWDRDLSIGGVKWYIGLFWGQYMYVQVLGFWSRNDQGVLVTPWISKIFVLKWPRKLKIGLPKIVLTEILIKINFLTMVFIFVFLMFLGSRFLIFPKFHFLQFWCKKCWTTLNIWYN